MQWGSGRQVLAGATAGSLCAAEQLSAEGTRVKNWSGSSRGATEMGGGLRKLWGVGRLPAGALCQEGSAVAARDKTRVCSHLEWQTRYRQAAALGRTSVHTGHDRRRCWGCRKVSALDLFVSEGQRKRDRGVG